MRTNVGIDDALIEEAFSVSRAKTKKDLINEALGEMIRLKKQKDLAELFGRGTVMRFSPGNIRFLPIGWTTGVS